MLPKNLQSIFFVCVGRVGNKTSLSLIALICFKYQYLIYCIFPLTTKTWDFCFSWISTKIFKRCDSSVLLRRKRKEKEKEKRKGRWWIEFPPQLQQLDSYMTWPNRLNSLGLSSFVCWTRKSLQSYSTMHDSKKLLSPNHAHKAMC